jgi:hypothetical protein
MADTPESLKKLAQLLSEQSDVYLSLNGTVNNLNAQLENYNEKLRKAGVSEDKLRKDYLISQGGINRLVRDAIKDEERLRRARKANEISIEEYNEAIESLKDTTARALNKLPAELQEGATKSLALLGSLESVGRLLNNDLTRGIKDFVSGIGNAYQSSKTGLEMSINIANSTFDVIFKLANSAAGAIPIVGSYAQSAISAVGESGKALLDFYGKETTKLQGAFMSATSAGFVFADGLTGLRNAASNAGLTVDLFAKALTEHRESVAQFGGSLTEGAKRIGNVTKVINVDRLQQLGYGLDEIPGLIADVGARMRRSGTVTDAEVARQTQAYAQNLRIIAELTGQDAKTLQQKAEQNERDLAFTQFLADKTPEEAEKIRQQMALLPPAAQDLFKEMAQTGGQIFSEQGNILAQQAPAVAQMARQLFSATEQGNLNAETSTNILKELGATAAEQIKSVRAFGTAAAIIPEFGEVGQKMAETYKMLAPLADGKTIEDILANVRKAGVDDPDSQKLRKAERDGMEKMVDIQNKVVVGLSLYLKTVDALNVPTSALLDGLNLLNDKIRELTGSQARSEFTDTMLQAGRAAASGQRLSTAGTGLFGSGPSQQETARYGLEHMTDAHLQKLAQATTTTVDKIIESAGYASLEEFNRARATATSRAQADADEMARQAQENVTQPALAEGGLVRGPNSGFTATLHGSEAVIPLPDGINAEMFEEFFRGKTATSDNSLEMIRVQQNTSNQQIDLLGMLNEKFDQMISLMHDVAGHTETTAARVA